MKTFRIVVVSTIFLFLSAVSSPNEVAEKYTQTYATYIITAYCPCKICTHPFTDGKTATNTDAYKTGVAVDPKLIPLGSRLDIPKYGNWILADDIGGAIKDKHIDIRFKTHKEALDWGIKKLKIRIWKKK